MKRIANIVISSIKHPLLSLFIKYLIERVNVKEWTNRPQNCPPGLSSIHILLEFDNKVKSIENKSCRMYFIVRPVFFIGRYPLMNSTSKRIGLYIDQPLLDQCDRSISQTNASSRSEFICDAIEFYITHLNGHNVSRILTPALESVIQGAVGLSENRLATLLFKLAVEMSIMMNVYAGTTRVNENTLNTIRKWCIDEVKRVNGRISFDDAVRYQNS